MAVLMKDGISQLAPVARVTVFIIHIVVVDADGKAGVIRPAVFVLNRRGIGQNIAVAVGIQVKLRNFDTRLIRQDSA